MRICILFSIWAVLVPVTLYSEELAITPDGRIVVLESDGSWRYRSGGEGLPNLSAAALAEMAGKALSNKDYESAEEYARRAAAQVNEVSGKAYFVLGNSRWASGDMDESLSAFEACMETRARRFASVCAESWERIKKSRLNFYDPPLDWGDPSREIIAEEPGQ